MLTADAVRRGLRFFLAGRAASGLLGLVWLVVLVRALSAEQIGLFFGFMALFEISQLGSSAGVYSYAQRFIASDWMLLGRAPLRRRLLAIFAFRTLTLGLAAGVAALAWSWVPSLLSWPEAHPTAVLFAAILMLEGTARFVDTVFECTINQGVSQSLGVLRNVLRIAVVSWALASGVKLDANWVLELEAVLASAYLLVALFWIARLLGDVPVHRPLVDRASLLQAERLRFSTQGYASLALGQVFGWDTVKLIVSHHLGPATLGVLAFAQSLADVVRRYMPATLLQGFLRSVLTARAAEDNRLQRTLFWARLLARLNAVYLALLASWLLVFGDWALRSFTARPGFGEAAPFVAAFIAIYMMGALRQMATLVAHVQTQNRAVLEATFAIVLGPPLAWAFVPAWGAAAAVATLAVQEAAYTGVLFWRLRLPFSAVCGRWQSWAAVLGAAAVAALVSSWVSHLLGGTQGGLAGSVTYLLLFGGLLWRLAPWDADEPAALLRALVRRPV